MKQIIAIATTILFIRCAPHRLVQDTLPNPFKIESIDSVSGSKDQLFVKANEWAALTYNSAKDVIQMHDKEAGEIILKGVFSINENAGLGSGEYIIDYSGSIFVKEGRVKIIFSDFILSKMYYHSSSITNFGNSLSQSVSPSPLNMSKTTWDRLRHKALNRAANLRESLLGSLKKEGANW